MSTRARVGAVLALAIAVGGTQAQQGVSSTTASQRPVRADPATVALAAKLTSGFEKNGSFDGATLERPEALAALAHVALTAKQAPLAQAAYETMASQLSERASAGRDPRETPALVVEAVLAGLKRTERPVLAKSIGAAVALNVGGQAHAQSLQALADLARRHPEADVRYAAVESLVRVSLPVMIESGQIPDVLVQVLDDPSAGVVAQDLATLTFLGPRITAFKEPQRRARLETALKRVRSAAPPALRAFAIGTSAALHKPGFPLPGLPVVEPDAAAKAFAAELLPALQDPSPVVRGMAAAAAGLMQRGPAIPRLGALLDDQADVSAVVGGVRSLGSGEPIELPVLAVDIDEPQTVAMAALRALMYVSPFAEPKPELRVECKDPKATFAACAKRAREWALGRR